MSLRFFRLTLAFILLFGPGVSPFTHAQTSPSKLAKAKEPYVLLISLDGFRYDYAERYRATTIREFAHRGVAAKALIPSFPTSTFPNHYTIVTGLYPEHHGIVENNFWDPELQKGFNYHDAASISDPRWWGGTPLWVLAEQQGIHSACFFWPGSDVEIQHTRPSYFRSYDAKVPNAERVAQIIEWLKLPEPQRPHFITMYLSEVDRAGHVFGPDAPETRQAVQDVDHTLAALFRLLPEAHVPVNVFIVSDHGMAAVNGLVDLSEYASFKGVKTTTAQSEFKVYEADHDAIDRIYRELTSPSQKEGAGATQPNDPRFTVYKRSDIPAHLHYTENARIGDLVVLANGPYLIGATALLPGGAASRPHPKGMHGYDVKLLPEMKGIFYAQGPDLKTGLVIDEFENIHIYPLIAGILGLTAPVDIDGRLAVLAPILKHRVKTAAHTGK